NQQEESSDHLLLHDDTKFAASKIVFFQYLVLAILLFLLSGFWQLQVQDPGYYQTRAERNRIRTVPIPGPRGKILDRDNRVIVDNHSSFSLLLSRVELKPEHLHSICEGLDLNCEDLRDRLKRYDRTRPKYEPIVIKEELTPSEIAFVEAHRGQDTFPEMELIHEQRRLYARDGLAAHVVGYTGEVSEEELNTAEFARYKQGDVIGKAGVERYFNDTLMGVDGQRRVVVDNMGRVRKVIDNKEAISGKSIRLTIDLDLQAVAELSLEGRKGAIVVLDPRSGEVLAMASRPAYDPNNFAGRIRSREWFEIVNNPDKPLLNRAIQAQLAPGSTFKPIVAMAGLESGDIDDHTTAHCAGGATFYGRFTHCHLKRGHGTVELNRAIAQSCDVFFYRAGDRMGIDKIAEYAERTGLGKRTGIDLPGEAEGIVPSTRWKIRHHRQKWYAGETISVAIGQGALTVTPIQLAYSIGGLVMGGAWHKPRLFRDQGAQPEEPRRAQVDPEHLKMVMNGMYSAVNEGGTAARSALPGIEFCGKTGTAQLISKEGAKKMDVVMKDNGWFVGFAPREAPELVAAAVVEEGEHGTVAAQIVRDVIKSYFDKRARLQRQTSLAQASPRY
ncbi:MAG TPA: penicillin-binding protein 2, partial [Bryobacteraceae bacterium]|nr:penicillin-binding protein 2 [Bryobacteraceae bacterium]